MSYWCGLISHNGQVVLAADRYNNGEPYDRILRIGKKFIVILAGNLFFGTAISLSLPECPGDSSELIAWSNRFSDLFRIMYENLKGLTEQVDWENVDLLLGGFFANGQPFLGSISSTDDFVLRLVEKPMSMIRLKGFEGAPEISKRHIMNFFELSQDKPYEIEKIIAVKTLPHIFSEVSCLPDAQGLVTRECDILVLRNGSQECFGCDGDQAIVPSQVCGRQGE